MSKQTAMSGTEWTLLLFLSVLWGGSFFFTKVAVTAFPPLTLVFVRFAIAALAVHAYVRARGIKTPRDAGSWASMAAMGLFNNLIPAGLIAWAQTMIPSGLAAVIIATTPIFSMLIIHVTGSDEKLTPGKVFGGALGLAGVAFLFRLATTADGNAFIAGVVACLGAAASYGCANALGARFRRLGIAPAVGAMGQMATTAVMALPLMLTLESPWRLAAADAAVWASMAGLALLSTALGYVVFFRILASAGGTNISLVTLLIPVSAVLLGSLILGERIALEQVAGMLLIALGLIAIDGRAPAWAGARIREIW